MDNLNCKVEFQLCNDHLITDCDHLIDLPSRESVFSNKAKGEEVRHPKAMIKVLTVLHPKNGLSNLL